MSTSVAAPTQHIPAWKRLGLKLKNQGTPEKSANSQPWASPSEQQPATSANKHWAEESSSPKAAKKRRTFAHDSREHTDPGQVSPSATTTSTFTSKVTPQKRSYGFGNHVANTSQAVGASHTKFDNEDDHQEEQATVKAAQIQESTPASRRKSVAFTQDTKAEDGSSAQDLIRAWEASEQFDPGELQAEEQSPPPSAVPKPSKTSKKAAKQQKGRGSATKERSATVEGVPEYVRYLEEYSTDKASWKFNKNKQQNLLKHIFDLHRIPPEYDPALIDYISGLQGIAAQQRLLDDAEGVLQGLLQQQNRASEIEGMDSRTSRKAAYEAALQREIATLERSGGGRSEYDDLQLQEIRGEVARAQRAESVLGELLRKELAPPSAPTPPPSDAVHPTAETTAPPNAVTADSKVPKSISKRRKRKARTEVSSDESSNDSGESEGE